MPAKPFASDPPLQFRGIPDSLATSHLEGSECCLIHADSPLRDKKRTYVNPHVRVGYSDKAYDAMHQEVVIRSFGAVFIAVWNNRIRRWMTSPWLKEWLVHRKVQKWRAESEEHKEMGEMCLINEMQVLAGNGWAHV